MGMKYHESEIAPNAPVYSDHPLYRGAPPATEVYHHPPLEEPTIPEDPEPLPTFNPTLKNSSQATSTSNINSYSP